MTDNATQHNPTTSHAPLSIGRITVNNFRNYQQCRIDVQSNIVILSGHNGAGKTNLLEAISLLASGRGIRNAKLTDLNPANPSNSGTWSVFANIHHPHYDDITIATGFDNSGKREKRLIKINGENNPQSELPYYMNISYLTPVQDHTFIDGSTSRRAYLDRLTSHFFADHIKHLSQFAHAKSERKTLLSQPNPDSTWLSTIERRMAEYTLAIIASRVETIAMLQRTIDNSSSPFPKAIMSCTGTVESLLLQKSALEAEDEYRSLLKQHRSQDKQSGRTEYGPHKSDFLVIHSQKNMPAQHCSTGEQKALLLSILLAEISAKKEWSGYSPIVLLDEVVAHLDPQKRQLFYDEIHTIDAQYWFTGTNAELFKHFGSTAQFLEVENNTLLG